ncbi:MAG: GPR1/FUN34/YaaH family transporter [Acidobacteriota bacterium]
MNDLTKNGNLVEAVLWFIVSFILLAKTLRSQGPLRRVYGTLTIGFFTFAISDIIESRTGAWWRPWWLFVIKAGCALSFILGFREYYRIKKRPKT